MDPTAFQAELVHVGHRIGWGLLASAAMALGAWKVRALTIGGAVVNTLIGAAIFSLGGFQAWLMYLAASTVAVTSWRVDQRRRGPTPASHGAASAIASGVIALGGAWLIAAIGDNATGALIVASAMAAWAGDAIASEIDKGYGMGAGVVAMLVTSLTMAGLFALVFPTMHLLAPFIVLGSAAGSITAGALGRRYEANGVLNDDALLFLNTFVAATIACVSVLMAVALRNRLP